MALAPDHELHAQLVESAVAWAEHYRTTGTDKKWWKHLHTWLVEERYLEDLPEPYENPKDAAIARAHENGPRRAATAEKYLGLSHKTPLGRHDVLITNCLMPDDPMGPEQRLKFFYRIQDGTHGGKEFSHTFKYQSDDEELQSQGQSIFASIRRATGKCEVNDTSELVDLRLHAIVSLMGRIQYEAAA